MLKQASEPAQPLGPGYGHLDGAVFQTLDPGHVTHDKGLVLTSVPVPPPAPFIGVDVRALLALRTAPESLSTKGLDLNFLSKMVHSYLTHRPRRFEF
jgi:hypothetical protein